ncbi:MAG: shikimate kinase [Peptococcaceae bacterium]|jgi:shikimate kinase|nr:shikimate kinase [Peptococcaceae bacterium]MDH7525366.1 shikimate kinase [Peptococcaceae bacterium]
MKPNIVLIGFMGTGKTAVGKRLAALLNKTFYDTDQEIEEVSGMTVSQLFNKYGEVRFRSEENLAVARLAQHEDVVIATGGGVVLDKRNMELLAEKGIIICLTASPEVIYERVRRRNNRPLLRKGDMYQTIKELLAQREDFYRCADFYIDTSDMDLQDIIDRIIAFLNEYRRQEQEKENA